MWWDAGAIRSDLRRSLESLTLGGLPRSVALAYPYGGHSPAAIQAARSLGLRLGFTVEQGCVGRGDDPFTLKRWVIFPGTGLERFAQIVRCERA